MNRIIAYAVIFVTVMMLVGVDISGLTQLMVLVLILFAAGHFLARRSLPSRFWSNFALLIFGPTLLICLVIAILNRMSSVHINGNWHPVVLFIALVAYGLYGWYWWQNRRNRRMDQSQLRSGEREFIVPFDRRPARSEEPIRDEER